MTGHRPEGWSGTYRMKARARVLGFRERRNGILNLSRKRRPILKKLELVQRASYTSRLGSSRTEEVTAARGTCTNKG